MQQQQPRPLHQPPALLAAGPGLSVPAAAGLSWRSLLCLTLCGSCEAAAQPLDSAQSLLRSRRATRRTSGSAPAVTGPRAAAVALGRGASVSPSSMSAQPPLVLRWSAGAGADNGTTPDGASGTGCANDARASAAPLMQRRLWDSTAAPPVDTSPDAAASISAQRHESDGQQPQHAATLATLPT